MMIKISLIIIGFSAFLLNISYISTAITQTQILPSILAAQLPEPGTCGPKKLSYKIFGGTNTSTDEFPWMVLIEYTRGKDEKEFKCGGSLISDRYVLTAAHCVAQLGQGLAATGVRLGEWDIKTDPDCEPDGSWCADRHVDVPIEKIISHPGFQKINGHNDIALIRLSRSVNYTDYISPICLPVSDHLQRLTFDKHRLQISGWGITKTESKQVNNIKQKAEVEVVPFSQCQSKQSYRTTSSQMCSFGKNGIGTCVGDSGGPLFGLDASKRTLHYYFIAGIVSQGPAYCGSVGVPVLYTKVSNFTDWILENMHSLNQKDARLRAKLPGPDECGHIISYPIFDTNITRINEYPWMALIEYIDGDNKTKTICTGSLINQRYVLTSAHCIKGYEDNLTTVRLGEWNTKTNPDCQKYSNGLEMCADQYISVPIEKAVPHEYYSFKDRTRKGNRTFDIGLLRLSRRIEYTDSIRPICLPLKEHHKESTFDGLTMYISGWKLKSLHGSYNRPSKFKLKNEVHVVPFRDCQRQLNQESMLYDLQFSQMCVYMEKRLDSCVDNIGGPLIGLNKYNSNKVYYFTAGIPSFGFRECPGPVVPDVYTRVSAYVDWIQENIEP